MRLEFLGSTLLIIITLGTIGCNSGSEVASSKKESIANEDSWTQPPSEPKIPIQPTLPIVTPQDRLQAYLLFEGYQTMEQVNEAGCAPYKHSSSKTSSTDCNLCKKKPVEIESCAPGVTVRPLVPKRLRESVPAYSYLTEDKARSHLKPSSYSGILRLGEEMCMGTLGSVYCSSPLDLHGKDLNSPVRLIISPTASSPSLRALIASRTVGLFGELHCFSFPHSLEKAPTTLCCRFQGPNGKTIERVSVKGQLITLDRPYPGGGLKAGQKHALVVEELCAL